MGASCFGDWALNDRVVNETNALAKELGCFSLNANDVKACMKQCSVEEILQASEKIVDFLYIF